MVSPRILAASCAALLLAGAAQAQTCLDQNAPTNNACMAGWGQVDLAQSFQQSSTTIEGAGIFLTAGSGAPETLTISLWSALPNAGGTLLASGTGYAMPGAWFDVFWGCTTITPGVTYYLVFSTSNNMCYAGDSANGYPNGHVYANPGFQPFPFYDYTFRTYSCCGPSLAQSGSCPGPVTLVASNCTPGGSVAILYGQPGVFVKQGNPCSGLVLAIAQPTLAAMITANGSGTAVLAFNAPAGACGRTVQAVNVPTCQPTNAIVL